MTTQREIDLIFDLNKLIKKHGAGAFRDLASVLEDQALTSDLLRILKTLPRLVGTGERVKSAQSAGVRNGNSYRHKISELTDSDPERGNLLLALYDDLIKPNKVPLAGIRNALARRGLSCRYESDRRTITRQLIESMRNCPIDEVRAIAQDFHANGTDSQRALSGWSRIILDPELRAKRGA